MPTADTVNPYEGGGPAYSASVEDALEGWAARHDADVRDDKKVSDLVTRITYRGREGLDDVVLYRIDGAGHVWPGTSFDLPASLGPRTDDIDATRVMLEFFGRYRLP